MRRSLLILAALLVLAPAPAALAAADFNAIEAELMCDTCNVPLTIAESGRANQERAEIRRLIRQGKTKQEILDAFVAEYGPNVLADPIKGGGSPAVWAVPLGILVAAAIAIALLLPRWRRRRREEPAGPMGAPGAALSADDEARLKRDLALYDL